MNIIIELQPRAYCVPTTSKKPDAIGTVGLDSITIATLEDMLD